VIEEYYFQIVLFMMHIIILYYHAVFTRLCIICSKDVLSFIDYLRGFQALTPRIVCFAFIFQVRF